MSSITQQKHNQKPDHDHGDQHQDNAPFLPETLRLFFLRRILLPDRRNSLVIGAFLVIVNIDRICAAVIILNQIFGFLRTPVLTREQLIKDLAAALAETFVPFKAFLFSLI